MQQIVLWRVREQRRRWWESLMLWFDFVVAFVGTIAILWVGWLLIEWAIR